MDIQQGPVTVVSCDDLDIPISPENSAKFDVTVNKGTSAEALKDILANGRARVLVVRSATPIPAEVVSKYSAQIQGTLKAVIRAGVGTDGIAVQELEDLGVKFLTTPTANIEYTAMRSADAVRFLSLPEDTRNEKHVEMIGQRQTRDKKWKKIQWDADARAREELYPVTSTLQSMKVGVVGGLGNIGQRVGRDLQRCRARVFVLDRDRWAAERRSFDSVSSIDELADRCDIVTVHVPGNEETRGLIGKSFFDAIPDGRQLSLNNMSRGSVVDHEALLRAMEQGRIGPSVLDVLPVEGQRLFDATSTDKDWKLIDGVLRPITNDPRIFMTHHSGASTPAALTANAKECARIIEGMFCGEAACE